MGESSENKLNKYKKHICMGIVAHVDAGKTTLSEGILYTCGAIRKMGRVDHQDAYLDNFALERARGITIFSKQAMFSLGNLQVTLLDTPGHVDFSAEMERTLQVLDYAVLVVSGADGVQSHTLTLWKLLKRYEIPVFLFINKMDQPGTDRPALMEELSRRLDNSCVDFSRDRDQELWKEQLAMCDETLLETYLETGTVDVSRIPDLIAQRKVFPCYFGSALKLQGVESFLEDFRKYVRVLTYPEDFGAKVFKIARDGQGNRLTYMKITGGSLKVKTLLSNRTNQGPDDHDTMDGEDGWEEKADQIRMYSGEKYELVNEVKAGSVCAVTGLSHTYPGQGLGIETASEQPVLEPVLTYQIQLPEGSDVHKVLGQLRILEEEEPLLHIVWNEELEEIHAQVMGEVQIEVLRSLLKDRFQLDVNFGAGNIVYKETICEAVEGVGHFEPLRHYAEVHLLLEPGERGSGLQFAAACSEDLLDRNWQRLILTHLEEKEHRGVLMGASITDMKITLLSGRAHIKHTEGGDFRQATYRAVRHGLRCTESVLLEPWYEFRLELPSEYVGRAMTDIQRMNGECQAPQTLGETTVLSGQAPVAAMRDYQREVLAYSRGHGQLQCTLKGYFPCHNQDEVLLQSGYDPDGDLANPCGSVFCAHGAGFVVPWDQVESYMHLEHAYVKPKEVKQTGAGQQEKPKVHRDWKEENRAQIRSEKELEEIFTRTYGPIKREKENKIPGRARKGWKRSHRETGFGGVDGSSPVTERYRKKTVNPQKQYLLVDGYNIIFAWDDLRELSEASIDAAREKLMDILCNYQGYKKCTLILVFDAYKVEGNPGSTIKYHNIHVVYTKEAETADQYIEKTVHEMGKKYDVTVATSDQLEQVIILGQGGRRISAREFREEVEAVAEEIRREARSLRSGDKNYLFDQLDEEAADYLESVRLGKNTLDDMLNDK